MILSIIIISHNQKEEFRRCIDSILAQELPFEHEIIISDDASADGSFELAKEYETLYPGVVKACQCNSNDCNPANNSHRSGWNRCNAYKHASGKYIAHVDGDDYFRPGADVYRKQVEALEAHPECSLAMSNVIWNEEGLTIEESWPWFKDGVFEDGRIMTGEQMISNKLFIINQACMERRNPAVDPVALYGKRYVDSVITYHHLQFGNVVCVDACDYVYVQSKSSIAATTSDSMVLWCNGIYIPTLMPRWRHNFYLAYNREIRDVVSLARRGYRLQDKSKKSLEGLGVYIYNVFNRPLTLLDKLRLFMTTSFLRAMQKYGWNKKIDTQILHFLLCK